MNDVSKVNFAKFVSSGFMGFFSVKAAAISPYLGLKITALSLLPIGIALFSGLTSNWIIQKTGILKEKNFVKREFGCLAITLITSVALGALTVCFTGTGFGALLISSALLGVALRISSLINENLYFLLVAFPFCKNLEKFLLDLREKNDFFSHVQIDQGLHLDDKPTLEMIGSKYQLKIHRLFLSMHFQENKKVIQAKYKDGFDNEPTGNVLWSCENVLENKNVLNVLSSETMLRDCCRTGLPDVVWAYRLLKNMVSEKTIFLKKISPSSSLIQKLKKLKLQIKIMKKKTLETIVCWRIIHNCDVGQILGNKDIDKANKLRKKWDKI